MLDMVHSSYAAHFPPSASWSTFPSNAGASRASGGWLSAI